MYHQILVAVDGSEHSVRALQHAARLARAFDSRVILVHAYGDDSTVVGSSDYSMIVAKRKTRGAAVLDSMRAELDGDLQVSEELVEGPADEAVAQVARDRNVDLLVVGSRGLGWVEGVVLGSVSRKLTQQAPCTVLVVR